VTIRHGRTGAAEVIRPAGAFVFIGQMPNTAFLGSAPITLDRWGFVVTGHDVRIEPPAALTSSA